MGDTTTEIVLTSISLFGILFLVAMVPAYINMPTLEHSSSRLLRNLDVTLGGVGMTILVGTTLIHSAL